MSKKILYHYCNNVKALSILQNHLIRLSDISKSNDYLEMKLFFPRIFDVIFDIYLKSPFPLIYKSKKDIDALMLLLDDEKYGIEYGLSTGHISNFAVCFSEKDDMLSQWRGYAADGQGISIGFNKDLIQTFATNNNKVLNFRKVKYLTEDKINDVINKSAAKALQSLNGLREWIVDNITKNENDPNTEGLFCFNFHKVIVSIMTDSLQYKLEGFKEEHEWRLYLRYPEFKVSDWIFLKDDNYKSWLGSNGLIETIEMLNGKMDFNLTENDLIPFFSLPLDDISEEIIKTITLGPNNKIKQEDIKLFLCKYNYHYNINIVKSNLSYIRVCK